MLARALSQTAAVLVLDEPTNHLDTCHQREFLSLVRRLEVTTLVALHDLNLAHAYCDLFGPWPTAILSPPVHRGEVRTPSFSTTSSDYLAMH